MRGLWAIVFLCSSGAWAAEGHGHMGNWYECKQVSDCVVVPAICGGPASVNRAFKDKFEKWAIVQAIESGCKRDKKLSAGLRSACEKGNCVVKHPPAKAAPKAPEKK
jgi:hypothetical protein